MKKQLSILLALCVFMSLFAFPAFAGEEPVAVAAQVRYTDLSDNPADVLPAGGQLTVSCEIERIDPSDRRTQDYIFFTIVTKNGSIVSAKKAAGQVGDGEIPSVTVDIPSDTQGVAVESYLWDGLLSARPLAEKATFGSDVNTLLALYLDGEPMEELNGSAPMSRTLPASYSHVPQLRAVAADSSAKIEIEEITTLPQEVEIKVTSHTGVENSYQLTLDLANGTVSNPIALLSTGDTQNLTMAEMAKPVYNDLKPGDVGFSYMTVLPGECTYYYSDRAHSADSCGVYYVDFPDELLGATAVQPSLNLLRYDAAWKDSSSADTEMQWFTIDRSADVYLICMVQPSWLAKEGFVNTGKQASITFSGDTSLYKPAIFKKTYIVPEGEALTVGLKGLGANGNGYSIAVKFLEPTSVASLSDVYVAGAIDFTFDPTQTEQTVNLAPGTTEVPEISYVTSLGATVNETKATDLSDATEITITSADGNSTNTYRFNFEVCENKLSAITVGGKAWVGFDPDVNEYTYKLPFGDSTLLEVSATGANGLVTVDVQQATAPTEEGAAIITCTFYDNSVNTYKIIFKETLTEYEEITSGEQFAQLLSAPGGNTAKYKLMNDITMPDDYEPIASFSGELISDENAPKSITLNINKTVTAATNIGLFAKVTSAVRIENIILKGSITVSGTATKVYVGALFGLSDDSTVNTGMKINNIRNEVNITIGNGTAGEMGGIAGRIYNGKSSGYPDITFTNLVNTGNITQNGTSKGNIEIGGIAGVSQANLSNCENYGNITLEKGDAAGICCRMEAAKSISHCYNAGTIKVLTYGGGIVFWRPGQGDKVIEACYNIGAVTVGTGVAAFQIALGKDEPTNCFYLEGVAGRGENAISMTLTEMQTALEGTASDEFMAALAAKGESNSQE